ncbi:MAG: Ig-like domain-containing protein, partial [Nioella sp.]
MQNANGIENTRSGGIFGLPLRRARVQSERVKWRQGANIVRGTPMNTYDRDIATPASATRDDAPARVTVASEADRRAHVAKWIARHHKSAAATLGTAVLFLPAVAGAQTAGEGLVDAAGIDGVQDVQLLDDGSARVTLDNGQVLNVSADDVVIGDAGEVQVSDQVADILAEQAATSGGGGGGASGGAIAAGAAAAAGVAAVAASGGGGGGGTSEGPTVVNSEDVAGFRTFSDVFGREPDGDPDSITITVEREGGNPVILTDPADRDDETGEWLLPDSFADEFEGLDNEEITVSFIAEKEVPPEDGDDNVVVDGEGTNEIRALNGPEPEPDVVDKGEVTLLVDTVAPEITIDGDIAGDGVLNIEERDDGFEITGTTSAEVGQEVRVGLAIPGDTDPIDVTGTVVAADDPDGPNEWRVTISPEQAAELGDGEDVDVLAVVDDAAGNPVDDRASATFTTDFTAPEIAINDVDEIGAAEAQNGLQITGTASGAEGQDVTVTFDGETYTGTVTAENWSVNIPDTAVQAVQDRADEDEQAEVEISATVEDAARNPAEETPTQTVTADFTGPSITINDIAEDNILNIAEREGDVTISGTTGNVGDGQEVTVAVGNETYTETVNGGTWSATLPQADAAALEDGTEIEVTAEVSDEDDVAATPATKTLTPDFTAPTIAIEDDIAGDGLLNIAEQDEGLTISGTTDAEIGQDVTVTLSRGVGMDIVANATVVEAADPPGLNEWSVTYTPEQLQDLGPETEVTVEATVDDAAGNPAETPANATFETDFTAPTVGIDALPLGGDGTLNAAESDSDLEITGTATDTDEVAVTFNGTELAPATVTDDSWSVTVAAAELQDLDPEATIDVQATAKDAAGNTAEEDTSFDTDFTAPELTVDPLTIGEFLSIAEAESAVTVTGMVSGNDGEDVTVAVGDQQETATVDQQGGWTATFAAGALSGLDDGETAFTVTTQDAAGNEASVDSDAVTVDLTAPEITVDDPPPQPFTLGLDALEDDDEGFSFTTSESGDATVTLTFTRTSGSEEVDIDLTENLSDIPFEDGSSEILNFPLTADDLATLEDQTEYDVEIAITDAAGNT